MVFTEMLTTIIGLYLGCESYVTQLQEYISAIKSTCGLAQVCSNSLPQVAIFRIARYLNSLL